MPVPRDLLRLSCPALLSISPQSDIILLPEASDEAVRLLVDVVTAGGEETGAYGPIFIFDVYELAIKLSKQFHQYNDFTNIFRTYGFKHRENRKTLPREHCIRCQICQVVLN